MLKIFTSNTGNNAAHLVMDELKKNNTSGSNHIVIVPDRFAMSVEKEIFDYLGLDGAFNIDVVSFTRLAIKSLTGRAKQCLTKEGGVVLLSAILIEEKNNLSFYHRLVGKRELAKDLYAVIASLRSSRITPDRLREVFGDKPGSLRDKYEDIAHLIEVYESRLAQLKGDSLTRLNRFEEGILNNQKISNSHIYVIGFDAFKGNEYDIIAKLVSTAQSVNVALNIGEDGAKNAHLFSLKEARRLERENAGTIIRATQKLPRDIESVYSNLFAMSNVKVDTTDRITLVAEPTTYDEIKGIALEICSLIREGYRYTDIAVVVHDDSLKPIIEDIFTRLNIPIYVDKKYPLKDTLVARLVDSAVNVLTSGYERDRVLAFAKNPILGIPYQDIENLNDYILRNNLNYQYLEQSFLGDGIERLEETRRAIIDRVPRLESRVKVRQGIELIKQLYQDVQESFYDGLYGEAGVSPNRIVESINKRAIDLINQELDEFCSLIGDEVFSLEDFYSLLKGGIESVEISLIPNVIDAVFVGTTSDSRFFDKRIIFIAGAVDGVMPVAPSYHAIMPERDVMLLEEKEVFIYPTPLESIRRDKGGLAELITTATDRVYVSYAQYSVGGARQNMGELFKQLSYILSNNEIISLSSKYSKNNAESLAGKDNAYYEYLRRKRRGLDQGSKEFINALCDYLRTQGYDVSDRSKSADGLATPIESYLTTKEDAYYVYPTQIEQFYRCPYKHFLKYALSLQECDKGDADARLIGIFLHEVLEKFFIATKDALKGMTAEEVEGVAQRIANEVASTPDYAHLNNDPKNHKLLLDIKKESVENILRIVPQIQASSFAPAYFEYRFVEGGLAVTVGKKEVFIRGTIDRIDVFNDKFFVVDYKTGSVKDKDKTYKLYYGTNLQLYLYLLALIKKGLVPVGAFYLSISAGYEKDGDRVSRFVGKTTTDEDVLRDMDNTIVIGDTQVETTALPSALRVKNSTIYATDNAGFSRSDFEFSAEYARGMVAKALELMSEAYVAKHPVKGECEYCDYWALCKGKKERKLTGKTIKNGSFSGGESNE